MEGPYCSATQATQRTNRIAYTAVGMRSEKHRGTQARNRKPKLRACVPLCLCVSVFFLALGQASNEFDLDATDATLHVDTDLCTSITMMRVDVAIAIE
jgi:hypothetical protein